MHPQPMSRGFMETSSVTTSMRTDLRDSSFHLWYAVTTPPNRKKVASKSSKVTGTSNIAVVAKPPRMVRSCCGNRPAAVPSLRILPIRRETSSKCLYYTLRVISAWLSERTCAHPRGQRIRINRGSLEGVEGISIKNKAEWRMVVSVTMLQRVRLKSITRGSTRFRPWRP